MYVNYHSHHIFTIRTKIEECKKKDDIMDNVMVILKVLVTVGCLLLTVML